MTTGTKRLWAAFICTIFLHGLFLGWNLQQERTIPTPLPIQRIAVSLGEKKVEKPHEVVETLPPVPEKIQPKVTPEPAPKVVQKIIPLKSKHLKHLFVQKEIVDEVKVVAKEVQAAVEREETEISDNSQKATPAAARVIDEATPLYRVNPPPKYPRIAKRRGQEGLVLLEALISIAGRVNELKILKSSGHSLLDNAALRAVRTWSFSPGSVDGMLEEMSVKVPVRFRLN